jgi:hypothetical protein
MIRPGGFYAGVGSRETPTDILELMTKLASALERDGMILRSGGADGADTAFEAGVSDPENRIIYIPWKGFSGRGDELNVVSSYTAAHAKIAAEAHPNWGFCRRGARALHTRNVAQVLGDDCETPSEFVICWTVTGGAHGGTGQAIRIADKAGIPVLNLRLDEAREAAESYLETGELSYERE